MSAEWTWWPPRSEQQEVFTTSTWNWMSLLISTPYALFFSPALPFVLIAVAHSLSELNATLRFFIPPPPSTPTLFLSPTPPVYLFFHQIELAESKGIPTIPSQSWVRERETQKMKGSEAQFRCRSLSVCVAMGVDLCLGQTKRESLLPQTPRRILRLQDGTILR